MNRLQRPLAHLLTSVLLAAGCAEEESTFCDDSTASRADPSVDFTAIQTFAVLPAANYPDELPGDLPDDVRTNLDAANEATRGELLALGLTEVDASMDPDVFAFSLAASEGSSGFIWQCVPGWVWWGVWGWTWDPCAWVEQIPFDYNVGTVMVGLADPDTEDAVFGGYVQGVLECGDAQNRLESGVSRIFADYPADQTGG